MAACDWKIEKYARFVGSRHTTSEDAASTTKDDAQWQFYSNLPSQDITLSVAGDSHLILTVGDHIHENHSLWNASSWMKGISKGDSMLFVYKVKNESRRFRVKFSASISNSGIEQCIQCVAHLQRHFHVKKMNLDGSTDNSEQDINGVCRGSSEPTETLRGTVTISKLAQVMSGRVKTMLPDAYRNTNISREDLGPFIHLCLSDSSFPAFVADVERELASIIQEDPQ